MPHNSDQHTRRRRDVDSGGALYAMFFRTRMMAAKSLLIGPPALPTHRSQRPWRIAIATMISVAQVPGPTGAYADWAEGIVAAVGW